MKILVLKDSGSVTKVEDIPDNAVVICSAGIQRRILFKRGPNWVSYDIASFSEVQQTKDLSHFIGPLSRYRVETIYVDGVEKKFDFSLKDKVILHNYPVEQITSLKDIPTSAIIFLEDNLLGYKTIQYYHRRGIWYAERRGRAGVECGDLAEIIAMTGVKIKQIVVP